MTQRKKASDEAAARAAETEERLNGLLGDLNTLHDFLRERGQHTYELAQRFMANAQRDASSRAYDERQATMLEYQQYIWHEIAGRVQQLLNTYGHDDDDARDDADSPEAGES